MMQIKTNNNTEKEDKEQEEFNADWNKYADNQSEVNSEVIFRNETRYWPLQVQNQRDSDSNILAVCYNNNKVC